MLRDITDSGAFPVIRLTDRSLKVNFDGREVEYDVMELDELVHTYATTIHKAQVADEMYFLGFMTIVAAHTLKPVVYEELATAAGISDPTAKNGFLFWCHLILLHLCSHTTIMR